MRKNLKKDLGWKWYWIKLKLLFDFEWQYYKWLDNQYIYYLKKEDEYREKIKNLYSK